MKSASRYVQPCCHRVPSLFLSGLDDAVPACSSCLILVNRGRYVQLCCHRVPSLYLLGAAIRAFAARCLPVHTANLLAAEHAFIRPHHEKSNVFKHVPIFMYWHADM